MPHFRAGVGDTDEIMPAHRGLRSNDKETSTKHTCCDECYDGGKQGDREEGSWSSQQSWRGRCFSRCWFYILYLYFQEVLALAVLWPNSRQCLNSVINCFQHGQSFYTLSRLLILCLLIRLDEFIPIDVLWYCIPQEMHIKGRLSELKLIFPLPSSMKENVASVPLLSHNRFVRHSLIDLGLAVSESKVKSMGAWLYFFGSIS